MCPCGQWSRSHPGRATLVRHVLLQTATAAGAIAMITITTRTAPLAPAPRPRGVGNPALPRSLVSTCTVAAGRITRQATALPAAVAIAPVAVAAQHDLSAATRAQEQPAWSIHAHLGRQPKLPRWTDASQRCHTNVAPPSSARCRARCCIPSAAHPATGVAPKSPGQPCPHRPRVHGAHSHRPRLPGRPAGRPGRRNPSNQPVLQLTMKSATSPANSVGS